LDPDAVPDRSIYSPWNFGFAVVGGIASALVFAVLGRGQFEGFLLAHLAPLPLMIVALGLGIGHGATAALFGALLLSIWPNWLFGMAYGLLVALPAWLSCWALAGAPLGRSDRLAPAQSGWAIAAQSLTLAAAVVFLIGGAKIADGVLGAPLLPVQQQLDAALEAIKAENDLGGALKPEEIKLIAQRWAPGILALYVTLWQALNLWAAGRLTQISGMLKQPWPDVAAQFALPRALSALLLVGAGLAFAPVALGAAGLAIALPLGLAFGFQGLAVTHFWLRGSASSLLVLSVLYFCLGVFGAPMILFSLLGLADVFLHFRQKKTASPTPTEVT